MNKKYLKIKWFLKYIGEVEIASFIDRDSFNDTELYRDDEDFLSEIDPLGT